MTDFITAALKEFSNRLKSPFYSGLILVFLLVNIDVIVAIVFTDQNLIFQSKGLLKDEYIKYLLSPSELGDLVRNALHRIVLPLVITLLGIYVMPWLVLIRSFKRNENTITRYHEVKLKAKKERNSIEKQILEEEIETRKVIVEKSNELTSLDPTYKAEEIYKELKAIGLDAELENFSTMVYNGNQRFETLSIRFRIFIDTNELAEINSIDSDDFGSRSYFELTPLGKQVLNLYVKDVGAGIVRPEDLPF